MTQSVLFVCLGNICRSPLAEGVFRSELGRRGLAGRISVDSCGTGGWHVGEPPDPRSVACARSHDIDISAQRARQLQIEDFHRFDWIVTMDRANLRQCLDRRPVSSAAELRTFMSFVAEAEVEDVPDPYYGGDDGFEHVYDLLRRGVGPLLDAMVKAGALNP